MTFQYSLLGDRDWKSVVINGQVFFFTPTLASPSLGRRLSIISIALDTVKIFNSNHLYWLPSDLLSSTIMQMQNIEELGIKGTQLSSLQQVAKILLACPKIVKIEFSYTEQTQEELGDVLKKAHLSLESLAERFRQLTALKMSTTVTDWQNDVQNDPWLLLIRLLT